MSHQQLESPVDAIDWNRELLAHVVSPGPHPLVHGYDVEEDLARHCGQTELEYLALTGELPTPEQAASVEVALLFLAPLSLAEAPVHCAMLANLCGGATSNVIAVGAAALAEQARSSVAEHAALFAWLRGEVPDFPAELASGDVDERRTVTALEAALTVRGLRFPELFSHRPTPLAAALSVLWFSGVEDERIVEGMLVRARLPFVVAEALAGKPQLRSYAFDTPRFVYQSAAATAQPREER